MGPEPRESNQTPSEAEAGRGGNILTGYRQATGRAGNKLRTTVNEHDEEGQAPHEEKKGFPADKDQGKLLRKRAG